MWNEWRILVLGIRSYSWSKKKKKELDPTLCLSSSQKIFIVLKTYGCWVQKKKKKLSEFFMLIFAVSYRFFGVKKYYKRLFCTIDLEITLFNDKVALVQCSLSNRYQLSQRKNYCEFVTVHLSIFGLSVI